MNADQHILLVMTEERQAEPKFARFAVKFSSLDAAATLHHSTVRLSKEY